MSLRRRLLFAAWRLAAAATAIGYCSFSMAASDSPRTPRRDEVVESQLLSPAVKRTVRALTTAVVASPPVAEQIDSVRGLIEDARSTGDPRLLGYAEQLLSDLPESGATLVLQATIEQSRHRFSRAVELLDRAVAIDAADMQALLTRAGIALVVGDTKAAAADCARIAPLHSDVADLCIARTEALCGSNSRALDRVRRVALGGEAGLRAWALSLAGDIELQNGNVRAAIRSYVAALATRDDLYTRAALAEALIDDGQPRAALTVLARAPATDAVLLQRWRALRSTAKNDPQLAEIERELTDRIAVAAARNDALHLREAARFALERGDAPAGLALARKNWRIQREPADLRLLLDAGHANRNADVLREGQTWIAATGLKDRRLEALAVSR